MAYLTKRPLVGDFAESSMFFLEDHGFKNVDNISHLSVWFNGIITLYLPLDSIIIDYGTLFNRLYEAGYKMGRFEGSQEVKYRVRSKLDDLIFEDLKVT
jgi:hypothetical protein